MVHRDRPRFLGKEKSTMETIIPVNPKTLMKEDPIVNRTRFMALSHQAGGVHVLPHDISKDTEFLGFLQKHEICVYPLEKVKTYMDSLVKELNSFRNRSKGWMKRMPLTIAPKVKWIWVPATRIDPPIRINWEIFYSYNKPIPMHAVEKMAILREEYGAQVEFNITDYVSIQPPDPFLSVIFNGVRYVIDKWDEPGFKL